MSMENTVDTVCRICGLDYGESLYEDGFPRYVICECCYNESWHR